MQHIKRVLLLILLTACHPDRAKKAPVDVVKFRTEVSHCETLGEVEDDGRVPRRVRENLREQVRDRGGNVLFLDIERLRTRAKPGINTDKRLPEVILKGEAFRCP